MVRYLFEENQEVRERETWKTGHITSRVPGSGNGWYYVEIEGDERGPFAAEELEAV